jgi:hypothetical protein
MLRYRASSSEQTVGVQAELSSAAHSCSWLLRVFFSRAQSASRSARLSARKVALARAEAVVRDLQHDRDDRRLRTRPRRLKGACEADPRLPRPRTVPFRYVARSLMTSPCAAASRSILPCARHRARSRQDRKRPGILWLSPAVVPSLVPTAGQQPTSSAPPRWPTRTGPAPPLLLHTSTECAQSWRSMYVIVI